jgi:hypothetical protein
MADTRSVSSRDVDILAEIAQQYASIPQDRFESLLAELSDTAKDIALALVNQRPSADPVIAGTADGLREWAQGNRLPQAVGQ